MNGFSLPFQDFEVDLYLGQFWQDPRLAFGINRTIILGGMACEKFWLPDTFFVNSIDTRIHRMVFANKKIWINLINGTMMLSARWSRLRILRCLSFALLLGVEDTAYVTKEQRLTNFSFTLFFSHFCHSFPNQCFTSTVSSTRSKSVECCKVIDHVHQILLFPNYATEEVGYISKYYDQSIVIFLRVWYWYKL